MKAKDRGKRRRQSGETTDNPSELSQAKAADTSSDSFSIETPTPYSTFDFQSPLAGAWQDIPKLHKGDPDECSETSEGRVSVASQPCAACCGMVPRDPQDPTEDQWSSECSGEGGVCTADGAAADASAEKPANAAPFQRSVSKIHYQRQVTFYPIFIEKFEEPEYGENVALYKILPPSPFNQPTPSFGIDTVALQGKVGDSTFGPEIPPMLETISAVKSQGGDYLNRMVSNGHLNLPGIPPELNVRGSLLPTIRKQLSYPREIIIL
eukprot:GHVT01085725.1.p1 GENE.GHVT01085725.1~~GHVT01085725.1.p1  ORF type:complete len:266 (+),score=41.89 GHVT01085725.1:228-1025(+)